MCLLGDACCPTHRAKEQGKKALPKVLNTRAMQRQ